MTQTAMEARRLVGKAVLFLTLCWIVVVISVVGGAVRGASVEPLNIALTLVPGCALVPATYYAVELHRVSDPGRLNRLWPKALVYGVSGMVLLFGAAYALFEIDRS